MAAEDREFRVDSPSGGGLRTSGQWYPGWRDPVSGEGRELLVLRSTEHPPRSSSVAALRFNASTSLPGGTWCDSATGRGP